MMHSHDNQTLSRVYDGLVLILVVMDDALAHGN